MNRLTQNIGNWFAYAAKVWRREFYLVTHDAGALIFFVLLPLFYPVVYTVIYNPEVVRELPVAVVDNSRTAESRQLVRMMDATPAIKLGGYAANLQEARQWMAEKDVFGVVVIPEDYARKIGRGEQTVVNFYSDMSLLLRYRTFVSALTDVQLATGAQIRQELMNDTGMSLAEGSGSGSPINNEAYFLGDTEQGFASFIIPGIVVLILQQSMLLGITLLGGTASERRRRNRGIDPMAIPGAPASATVIGKAMCYTVIYLPLAIYILHFIPEWFNLPHEGSAVDYLLFIFPMLVASSFLGLALCRFVKEREMAFLLIVFTSVLLLFLSGLTWPRYAMSDLWRWVGDCIPVVWGVEGFIRINSNGATLGENATPFYWLWGLSAVYFILAWLYTRSITRKKQ